MTFTIGLDLDGCVYHFERTARYMLRTRIACRGDEVPAGLNEPSRNWDWIHDLVSKEDWKWLWTEGVKQGLFRYGHVVGGAIEGIQALSKLGDVIAITARPKEAVHDTLVWLSTMTDKAPLSGIVIQSHGQRKSEVRPLPHVFIDDGPHNLYDLLSNTESYVVRFSQPWNTPYDPPRGHGARLLTGYGWQDTVSAVKWVRERVVGR
jgi:deoxypyrimidine-specific 5' nucleotidase type C protein (NT5C)